MLRGSIGSVASHSSMLAFLVVRQGMDTVYCVIHAGGDDSPGVSPRMVRFAASLAAESADNVKGVVAARGDPVLRATAWHVKVRVRTIHCVARPASPGLPDLDLRYRSMFIAIWNLHRLEAAAVYGTRASSISAPLQKSRAAAILPRRA